MGGGRQDGRWIADTLGTSASSVQSFRSRNDIYRREQRSPREPESVFEGVLDHGERDGWGLWLDPAVAEDPIWKQHRRGVEAVIVKVAEDSIVLEADRGENSTATGDDSSVQSTASSNGRTGEAVEKVPRERGRVKWFDAEKGYRFLVRPMGEDLFVHHSEVQGGPSTLSPDDVVEYEVGEGKRGPVALAVGITDKPPRKRERGR